MGYTNWHYAAKDSINATEALALFVFVCVGVLIFVLLAIIIIPVGLIVGAIVLTVKGVKRHNLKKHQQESISE